MSWFTLSGLFDRLQVFERSDLFLKSQYLILDFLIVLRYYPQILLDICILTHRVLEYSKFLLDMLYGVLK